MKVKVYATEEGFGISDSITCCEVSINGDCTSYIDRDVKQCSPEVISCNSVREACEVLWGYHIPVNSRDVKDALID